ncbi:MAG: hypothetical protein AAF402_15370 [Pseudomonadota bacterium]
MIDRLRAGATVLCLVLLTLVSGCASVPSGDGDVQFAEKSDQQWFALRFRLHWPQDQALDFSPHLLIADRFLSPLIANYSEQLPLWRVHRRAARDSAGHRFSFLFYADAETADSVFSSARDNDLLNTLLDHGIIEELQIRTNDYQDNQRIAGTSDPTWSASVQTSWPLFIMGVSRSWIGLIGEVRNETKGPDEDTVEGLLDYYREVSTRVTEIWGREGRHAYLHHLNAVFGYTPVYIFETDSWQNF